MMHLTFLSSSDIREISDVLPLEIVVVSSLTLLLIVLELPSFRLLFLVEELVLKLIENPNLTRYHYLQGSATIRDGIGQCQ